MIVKLKAVCRVSALKASPRGKPLPIASKPSNRALTGTTHIPVCRNRPGLYGSIIIDPAGTESIQAELDYVVQLSDWTDEDPMTVFAKLKKQSDYYNFNQHTAVDFFRNAAGEGLVSAIQKRHMWNMMRMNMTDLSDISAYTYT